MVRKVMALVIVGGALAVAACNTVRGVGHDLGSAANCTENAMHGGRC
ncbi:MAG: entericidin EcnA/B family protein [Sphingomonas sp.]|nr:entericidin EcnA/B family protein [Sphingomonas sp.]